MSHRNIVISALAGIATALLATIGLIANKKRRKPIVFQPFGDKSMRIAHNGREADVKMTILCVDNTTHGFRPTDIEHKAISRAARMTVEKLSDVLVPFVHAESLLLDEDHPIDVVSLHHMVNGEIKSRLVDLTPNGELIFTAGIQLKKAEEAA